MAAMPNRPCSGSCVGCCRVIKTSILSKGNCVCQNHIVFYSGKRMWYNWHQRWWWRLAISEQMCYTLFMSTDVVLRASFELPLPPSINQQYTTVAGRRVLSKDSRRYKREVGKAIRRLRAEGVISDSLVTTLRRGFVGLFIDFFFETPHRRDLDGGLKITQDAICDALGVNDNRVVDVHLVKRIDPLRPRIEVELEAIPH
jgi:crossover junction endodeoxyribonuclease RusA